MVDLEFMEKVNPVINSAKGPLFMLMDAEVPEAIEFSKKFRILRELQTTKPPLQAQIQKGLAIIQEIKYKSINYYAKSCGVKTIIDLGCGFSPRGLRFKNSGINYIGIDLPAVIKDLKIAKNEINYAAADITNYASLEKVLKNVNDKVLIITDGVLTYFTESELKTAVENIHKLLKNYGGIWITPDFFNNDYISAVFKPLLGEDIFTEFSKNLKSSKKNNNEVIFRNGNESAVTKAGLQMLKDSGFITKKIPLISSNFGIPYFDKLTQETRSLIIENYKSFFHLFTYIDSDIEFEEEPAQNKADDKGFRFTISQNENALSIFLNGRLDTISSPELLEFYENSIKGRKDKKIIIDCTNLEYVSSAGLRVFLIMYKTNNGNFALCNTNEIVSEVLEQTGFKDIFCK